MTPDEVVALRALCEQAMAGPWPEDCERLAHFREHLRRTGAERPDEDVAFIGAARTALPELLEENALGKELIRAGGEEIVRLKAAHASERALWEARTRQDAEGCAHLRASYQHLQGEVARLKAELARVIANLGFEGPSA